ncbi:MAG: ATP-binding protein [Gemmatimonadota bacterium]|nr:ATP-binding protein [Gemmatimonadota bacterium]
MPHKTSGKHSYSLKGQLTLLFAALAVPLLLLHGWWSYQAYQGARQQAWADALSFADAVDVGLRQFLLQSEDVLLASARQSGEEWIDGDGCAEELRGLRQLLPFANVLLVVPTGEIICSAVDAPEDASAHEWPWFADFQARGEFLVGPPVEADFASGWILPMVAPIRAGDGTLRGALIGAMPLSQISTLLGGFRSPESQLTTVASADRLVMARSADADRYVGSSLPPLTGSDRLVAPGRWVATGPDLAGVDRTWGQVQTESGWVVYVGVPDTIVYGPALREAVRQIGGTLLIVLLGVLLATRSYTRIARALQELAVRTREGGTGEVPLPPETPSEIVEVVEQFSESLRARTRAEVAERVAKERFQSIFDNAVFGLYVATMEGRFLQVNPALVEMLGYDSEESLMSAGPGALYRYPEQRAALIEKSLNSGGVEAGTNDLEWMRADGSAMIARVGGKVIRGPGGEPVFEMIVQDVTEERRIEDELRQTQKMEAVGRLAGGVAHDFNNLLTVIGGNAELLQHELEPSDPLRDDLRQITEATQRATSLTRRLLTFSRTSRRGEETVDINRVIPELSKMLVPLIGEGIKLRTIIDEAPLPVSIDPGELEQLVLNLVLNARDAVRGHGEIVIETAAHSSGADDGDGVLLSVADDGIGMDAATLSRAFEPFFTTKPMGEGTGLGLSTVYGIVHRAGGEIDTRSEPGKGTRVEIRLPRAAEPTEEPDWSTSVPVVGAETILVVEDDELVGTFVARALRDAGFDVIVAEESGSALDTLLSKSVDVDLVLTDVVMPGLSGPELAEQLKALAPEVPVLFMSGYVDEDDFYEEFELRPETLLRKPFTATAVKQRVRDALDRSQRSRSKKI